jgi:hypothetical protein
MPKSPCAPGETRNRVTKKCRAKLRRGRPAKAVTPCAADQTRNRVTKKCRAKLRRGRPAKAAKVPTPKVPTPKTYTYRVDLYEQIGGTFKRRSTERYIAIDDESNNLFGGCMETILEDIEQVASPSGSFFDIQAYPENSYVTIITETPLKESVLEKMFSSELPDSCTRNMFAFKISKLE